MDLKINLFSKTTCSDHFAEIEPRVYDSSTLAIIKKRLIRPYDNLAWKVYLRKKRRFFLHIKATPCWSAGREKIPSSSLDIHGDLLGCWKCIVCCCSNHNMARYCTGWSIVILHCLKCECVPIIEKASRQFFFVHRFPYWKDDFWGLVSSCHVFEHSWNALKIIYEGGRAAEAFFDDAYYC